MRTFRLQSSRGRFNSSIGHCTVSPVAAWISTWCRSSRYRKNTEIANALPAIVALAWPRHRCPSSRSASSGRAVHRCRPIDSRNSPTARNSAWIDLSVTPDAERASTKPGDQVLLEGVQVRLIRHRSGRPEIPHQRQRHARPCFHEYITLNSDRGKTSGFPNERQLFRDAGVSLPCRRSLPRRDDRGSRGTGGPSGRRGSAISPPWTGRRCRPSTWSPPGGRARTSPTRPGCRHHGRSPQWTLALRRRRPSPPTTRIRLPGERRRPPHPPARVAAMGTRTAAGTQREPSAVHGLGAGRRGLPR
jgi:hypothetical protein